MALVTSGFAGTEETNDCESLAAYILVLLPLNKRKIYCKCKELLLPNWLPLVFLSLPGTTLRLQGQKEDVYRDLYCF